MCFCQNNLVVDSLPSKQQWSKHFSVGFSLVLSCLLFLTTTIPLKAGSNTSRMQSKAMCIPTPCCFLTFCCCHVGSETSWQLITTLCGTVRSEHYLVHPKPTFLTPLKLQVLTRCLTSEFIQSWAEFLDSSHPWIKGHLGYLRITELLCAWDGSSNTGPELTLCAAVWTCSFPALSCHVIALIGETFQRRLSNKDLFLSPEWNPSLCRRALWGMHLIRVEDCKIPISHISVPGFQSWLCF